jgi:hypothetical protein
MSEFVGYVGPSEIHDAKVEAVDADSNRLVVILLEGESSGRRWRIEFAEPGAVQREHPVGMRLYGLAELRGRGDGRRRFAFVNWDEADDRQLELEASDISWSVVGS